MCNRKLKQLEIMTKEIYQKTVDILLDAYNSRTLFHGSCCACAVGNIIAANNNIKLVNGLLNKMWECGTPSWQMVFSTTYEGQEVDLLEYIHETKEEIDSTNIPLIELMAIEKAFESAGEIEGGQYHGLCAVLDVMKDMVNEDIQHTENVERLETIYATIK